MLRPVRVLSIDGGGVRGYLPALLLAEIERRAARPATTLFDLVVGTSTGGIIGIGLATGLSAQSLADFYPTYGQRILVWGAPSANKWDLGRGTSVGCSAEIPHTAETRGTGLMDWKEFSATFLGTHCFRKRR